MEQNIENLISQMTTDEKISLLAGADLWHSVPLKRLGIPVMRVTDGPNGARGAGGSAGPTSACFPVGTALGATWDLELVEQVGAALAQETKDKGAHVLLAPTVNIHRSPLAGRNFECYSEDPCLTSRMAIAYINGLQGQGVSACIKHFACNDSEFERTSISSEVPERALQEIYLTPFRDAMHTARPWSLMSSYNKVNGVWSSENARLLRQILKDEWQFDGLVMSDWFGTYTPRAAGGGLDLEMPGPARWMSAEHLHAALQSGEVTPADLDDKVRRLLRLMGRVGAFDDPELKDEQAVDRPEHRALARRAAAAAIVLLKNEPIGAADSAGAADSVGAVHSASTTRLLPLNLQKIRSLAVIGDNAGRAQIMGGGSSRVTPHYAISPLEGIRRQVGDAVEVHYALGCPIHRDLPLLHMDWLQAPDGQPGIEIEFFNSLDLSGESVGRIVYQRPVLTWWDKLLPGVTWERFSARLRATLRVPEDGEYAFSLSSNGIYRLHIAGEALIDNWPVEKEESRPWENPATTGSRVLNAGQAYALEIEFAWQGQTPWREMRMGCLPPMPADPIGAAVELAKRCDAAVIVAGLTPEWESEGFDRKDMKLPGAQDELIARVTAANPNTVVVLNVGSPLEMPWLESTPAVLQAWYGGQETGNAIADVLFGAHNPSGKLPTTFPRRLQDNPAYVNYPGENGKVLYGEGLFVGYRYYDYKEVEPLFPFGHGLSYTSFEYSDLQISASQVAPGESIEVRFKLRNTGALPGAETAQLYLSDLQSSLVRPPQELKAFAKITLEPGETQDVHLRLQPADLAFYDDGQQSWIAEAGIFEVHIGSSSRDLRLSARFELSAKWQHGSQKHSAAPARLHTGLALNVLLSNEASRAVLARLLPGMLEHPDLQLAMEMSLDQIAAFVPQDITPERLAAINRELGVMSEE